MEDFNEWLERQNIDCNELTPELEQSLRQRFEAEKPPAEFLVATDECPQRVLRHYQ